MAQPVAETGAAAVELLLAVLDDGDTAERQRVLPTGLIVRASCGCPVGGAT
jgi:DNA-binding LacI/PurR family transcriptional regulator